MEKDGTQHMVMTAERQDQLVLGEIHVDRLPALWPMILPLLEKGCAHSNGHFTPKSVIDGMFSGAFRMVGMESAGVLTSIMVVAVTETSTGVLIFDCLLTGGEDMDAWLPYEAEMDEFARALGCTRVRAIGRRGLRRILKHWALVGEVLEREL